jgi:hypothetical protein
MVEEVEFGDRGSARQIRQNPKFEPFLADEDDARESTVKLKEDVPERALEDVTGEAADSKRYKAEQYGQAELTEAEKKKIDFSKTNVMHARSAKAIARGKGVDDWTSFYDETLEVDEHRGVYESAKKDERGRSGLGRDPNSEAAQAEKQARAHQRRKEGELDNAKDHAFQGDRDAQGFVQERVDEPGGSFGDVFDMSFSRADDGGLRGSGRDFERMEERHEERPQRAQTLDEKRSANPTRNPFKWVNAPNRFDYPGIDTVQPGKLHDDRSQQAQARDERDAAPFAPSKEAWAMAPGRFDWQGVDDVDPEAFHASRSKRARTRDEKEIAPQADSKQEWAMNPGRYDWQKVDAPDSYGPTMDEPVPSTERNTDAPEPFTTALSQQDVSLAPEEAFEGVGSGSASTSASPFGLAGDEDADQAFVESERERASGELFGEPGEVLDQAMGGFDEAAEDFVDDRDEQGSLFSFGMDATGTERRETREAVEEATEFGIDDRSDPSRGNDDGGMMGGIQGDLGDFGENDEDERNSGLFGF